MRTALILLAIAASTPVCAEEFPVQIGNVGPCLDTSHERPGPPKEQQLECMQKHHGQVKIVSARLCELPSGVWNLNYEWRCEEKK